MPSAGAAAARVAFVIVVVHYDIIGFYAFAHSSSSSLSTAVMKCARPLLPSSSCLFTAHAVDLFLLLLLDAPFEKCCSL